MKLTPEELARIAKDEREQREDEKLCANCGHRRDEHIHGNWQCTIIRCNCERFVGKSDFKFVPSREEGE